MVYWLRELRTGDRPIVIIPSVWPQGMSMVMVMKISSLVRQMSTINREPINRGPSMLFMVPALWQIRLLMSRTCKHIKVMSLMHLLESLQGIYSVMRWRWGILTATVNSILRLGLPMPITVMVRFMLRTMVQVQLVPRQFTTEAVEKELVLPWPHPIMWVGEPQPLAVVQPPMI